VEEEHFMPKTSATRESTERINRLKQENIATELGGVVENVYLFI